MVDKLNGNSIGTRLVLLLITVTSSIIGFGTVLYMGILWFWPDSYASLQLEYTEAIGLAFLARVLMSNVSSNGRTADGLIRLYAADNKEFGQLQQRSELYLAAGDILRPWVGLLLAWLLHVIIS